MNQKEMDRPIRSRIAEPTAGWLTLIELRAAAYSRRYDGQLEEIRRLTDALCKEQEQRKVPWWKRFIGIR